MSGIKDLLFDNNDDDNDDDNGDDKPEAYVRTYPVKMNVGGYDVNHYYDGDIPVYEVYDGEGNVIGLAQSTSELHEITNAPKNDDKL